MSVRTRRLALPSILVWIATAWWVPALAQEGPRGRAVDLAVENRAAMPARVYVLQAGHMVPLGLVEGGASDRLVLPALFVESGEPMQLVADLIGTGGGWYASDPVSVGPTATVELTIERDPAGVVVAVR